MGGSAVTRTPPRVLSIAGTDPTGGAGIQADLKSIAAAGGYGMAVVTALVAQNTHGVRSIHTPPVAFLREQLDAVSDDVTIDAVKIGMLGTAEVITTVTSWLRDVRPPVVVLDPVMVATSGHRLVDDDAQTALRALLPLVDLVTPNIPELAILAGVAPAHTWDEVLQQAQAVATIHGVAVLAKGGHLDGDLSPDALVSAESVTEFSADRVETTNTHGTGCSLSSGIAARAVGSSWTEAVRETKRWLTESLIHADALHVGSGNGPISHFAGLWHRGGLITAPQPEELARQWWSDAESVRAAIDELPFVRRLGDGTLHPEDFTRYLAQDAIYLRDYARALSRAATLAPSGAERAFWERGAKNTVEAEMGLHDGRLGLIRATASATTSAYLAHLEACTTYEVLIAAVLPCYWIYQDVGARLHAQCQEDHPYRDWLDTYADADFAAATRQAVTFVMQAAVDASEDVRRAMRDAFLSSTEHERAFFAAGTTEFHDSLAARPRDVRHH